MMMTFEQLREARDTLFEYAGALNHEAMNAGNNLKRIGLEKVSADLRQIYILLNAEVEQQQTVMKEVLEAASEPAEIRYERTD